MGFAVRPLPHGVLVVPPRGRAALLFAAAVWNFVAGSIGGRLWVPQQPIEPWFFAFGLLGGTVFLLMCLYALLPTRIEWSGARFRCRPPLGWPGSIDLPLAEVAEIHFESVPRMFSHPRRTVFVDTLAGDHLKLPLQLDSFVLAVNGTGAILIDARANPAEVLALVDCIRGGIDDARHQSVGYRRVATSPEPLDGLEDDATPEDRSVTSRRRDQNS